MQKAVNELKYRPWQVDSLQDKHRALKRELSVHWSELAKSHVSGVSTEAD